MSIDGRLKQLMPSLSALERALLVLQSLKEGKDEDPRWRNTMPLSQAAEFNRYIHLMNAANMELGILVGLLNRAADVLEMRFSWLVCMRLWREHIGDITRLVRVGMREPIAESEYALLVEKERQEWIPVEDLADWLAGDRAEWSDDELEFSDELNKELVTDEAWDREAEKREEELREHIKAGRLSARGRGRSIKVRAGDFEDFFGKTSGAAPEELLAYHVVPDVQADEVARERSFQKGLQSLLDWRSPEDGSGGLDKLEGLDKGLAGTICAGIVACWIELKAAEVVIEEISSEFGGVDPLKPRIREELVETLGALPRLRDYLSELHVEIDGGLPEPTDEDIELTRELARRRAPEFRRSTR